MKFVNSVTSNELKDSEINSELLNNKHLIVKAVECNRREVKRFINHIILIRSVFDKPVNKLIVIQALKFRSEWNKFLEFIVSDMIRNNFFYDYKKLKE